MMEGSPVDRIVYLILMIAGLAVIVYRRLHWREIFTSNLLLTCFIAYCAISVVWSDYPFIAFKRWFKSLGDPLMALIILSEASSGSGDRFRAAAMRVCSGAAVDRLHQVFSAAWTGYDDWSGMAFYTGVTTNKNMLGYLLLVFGLWFLCSLFTRVTDGDDAGRRTDMAICLLFLGMIAWLIRLANSQTALIALFVSSAVVVALGSTDHQEILRRPRTLAAIVWVSPAIAFDIWGPCSRASAATRH